MMAKETHLKFSQGSKQNKIMITLLTTFTILYLISIYKLNTKQHRSVFWYTMNEVGNLVFLFGIGTAVISLVFLSIIHLP